MIPGADVDRFRADYVQIVRGVAGRVRGKDAQVELATQCLLARGHLLIEDVPGVAKTLLAKELAHAIGGTFGRIQFTADLLPSDLLGTRIYDQDDKKWTVEEGPVFVNVLLGDEINRASPKTQAALLEIMAERQVTLFGETRSAEDPFLAICTQNPVEFYGTYGLPEAQVDRFTMRLELGYPSIDSEAQVIADELAGAGEHAGASPLHPTEMAWMIRLVRRVRVSTGLRRYIATLAEATRGDLGKSLDIQLGMSPRGSVALAACAQAHALVDGRDYAIADDVQELARYVIPHRLLMAGGGTDHGPAAEAVARLVARVPSPRRRDEDL